MFTLVQINEFRNHYIELTKQLKKELINKNEIKVLRMLLKNNKYCSQILQKKLNKEIQVNKRKLTKRTSN